MLFLDPAGNDHIPTPQGHDGAALPDYLDYRGQVLDLAQSIQDAVRTHQLLHTHLAHAYTRREAGRPPGPVIRYRGSTLN